jgi:hypothetical protein
MSRINRIIRGLEKLQGAADGIINAYVQALASRRAASFTDTKVNEIFPVAGSTLNRVAALKLVKDELAIGDRPARRKCAFEKRR